MKKDEVNRMDNENLDEKVMQPTNGWLALFLSVAAYLAAIVLLVFSCIGVSEGSAPVHIAPPPGTFEGYVTASSPVLLVLSIIGLVVSGLYLCVGWIFWLGLKVLRPNEGVVLTLFGKYVGTIKHEGFFYVNPFCISVNPAAVTGVHARAEEGNRQSGGISVNLNGMNVNAVTRKISLKATTHDNEKQKVNDREGNPIEVGIVVIWRVRNTARAVFNVDNYKLFLSTQADSTLRDVVRCYPYDSVGEQEKSLRGSSAEVAEQLKEELQNRVDFAGLEILEARITHLAYAPEIAAAMLQRQQATAIIEARQKIVDGAVGMVEMALNRISEGNICTLDDERKAQMVSNLLVVLCGNKDAQPVVNSGTLY